MRVGPRGAARYPKAVPPPLKLLVNETFLSLQGEGPWQGRATFFVRLAGCNLRCSYCDSVHAYFEGVRRTLDDLVEEALRTGVDRVLVTGGEPMAQASTPALCRALLRAGKSVSVETNGSFDLSALPAAVMRVVDVKTPGSGAGGSFLPSILAELRRGDALKFVILGREDYLWTQDFLSGYTPPRGVEVFLSPASGRLTPSALAEWLLADRLPVRLQLQLHKVLWGERRGV